MSQRTVTYLSWCQRAMSVIALLGFVLPACASPPEAESPFSPLAVRPAKEGEACGGPDRIACSPGLECHEERQELPPLPDSDSLISGPGGSCGGIAGIRCQEGLVCQMARDQMLVADGMGACGFLAKCVMSSKQR